MQVLGLLTSATADEKDSAGATGAASVTPAKWEGQRPDVADLLIAAVFAVLLVVQIAHHEMWRDEIHSWGLVSASGSLSELYANLRFTGHPGLWYLILWPVSWFADSPVTLQAVHAVVGMLLIATIALLSPFSRLEKLLLLSSYFVLFEYTVISRNYGLGFLIALLYAHMRSTRPDRLYLNACLLGLLANTNLSAFVLSGAFACEFLVDQLWTRRGELWPAIKRLVLPAIVYLALAAVAVATMWPSPDISWRTTGEPLTSAFDLTRFLAMLAGNVEALIPAHALSHWDASADSTLSALSVAALPALAFVFFLIFRSHPRLLIVPGLTFAGSVAVSHFVYATSIRHWGVNFIAFVAALWIQRVWSPARSFLAVGLLAISAAAGIAISVQQLPATFSEGRATANWIRENGPEDVALIGTPDTHVSVVAQYLGRPIYFLDCSCTDTYAVFHKRRDAFDESQITARLSRALDDVRKRPVVFLITHEMNPTELAALDAEGVFVTLLAALDRSMTRENFFVYHASKKTLRGGL